MCAAEDEAVCLAERKNKEKWSRDPRNTFWSNGRPLVNHFSLFVLDKTRFGYRLLEQMGWKDGKGLGAKEDGQKEHVKVVKKSDNFGKCQKEDKYVIMDNCTWWVGGITQRGWVCYYKVFIT